MTLSAQFVDQISASPTVRLDLSAEPFGIADAVLSPPPLRRSVASSMLADGARYPSTAYDNRVLNLTVEIVAASEAALAAQLQTLHRELDRPQNILRWASGNAGVVFFRTFRASDYTQVLGFVAGAYEVRLSIPAEPFAYGLRQTVTPGVMTNDPAAATRGQHVEIAGVLGDVATPLIFNLNTNFTVWTFIAGTRSRGTPSEMAAFAQAEAAGTFGADTSAVADAAMSGGSHAVVTFGTTTTLAQRVSNLGFNNLLANVDHRGEYRLLAVVRPTTTSTFQIRATMQNGIGGATVRGDTVSFTPAAANKRRIVDLGFFAVPIGSRDRRYDGPTGVETTVPAPRLASLEAGRPSGTGSLGIDFLALVPADEEFLYYTDGQVAQVVDGYGDLAPGRGSFLMVKPGVTNRVWIYTETLPNAVGSAANAEALITHAPNYTFEYHPRYLFIAAP